VFRTAANRVEAALSDARDRRASGDAAGAEAALQVAWESAQALEDDHPLRQVAAWRRAKLAHDAGDSARALAALEPVLAHPDPFSHYPRGLDACQPLARSYWDQHGYGAPVLRMLWDRYAARQLADGDRYLHWAGRVQLAWDLAAAGDLVGVRDTLEQVACLAPSSFRAGPTRDPRAHDAPSSVAWLQLDMARTALRAATWAADNELGALAVELMEDGAEEAGLQRDEAFWFLEPIGLYRWRGGLSDPEDYTHAWWAAAPRLTHGRAPLHRALAAAEQTAATDPLGAAAALIAVADLAAERRWGPEWEIDALLRAARLAGPRAEPAWTQRAADRAAAYGVGVFT